MYSRDVSHDVSPSPTTARLLLLVSALRKESTVAQQLIESYRLLLGTTRHVMARRLPLQVQKVRLIKSRDKATIASMVAKLDKLEEIYSPDKAHPYNEERVRGLFCAKADVLGPAEERGHTYGSFRAEVEERSCPLPYPAVDWDNIARLSASRGSISLTLPHPIGLPVHACEPGPLLATSRDDVKLKSRTYNPMGGKYTPPSSSHPFGQIDGFRTNLGPISFPKGPVKGYILEPVYDDQGLLRHRWVLHATPPGVRRRGARGLRR